MNIGRYQVVDQIIEWSADPLRISTRSIVPSENDEIFKGHFPGMALLPGTVQTEIMAQTVGYLFLLLNDFQKMPLLMGVDDARFRAQVEPGAELQCRAEVSNNTRRMIVSSTSLTCRGTPVSSSTIRLVMVDFPNETLREYMRRSVRRVCNGERTNEPLSQTG